MKVEYGIDNENTCLPSGNYRLGGGDAKRRASSEWPQPLVGLWSDGFMYMCTTSESLLGEGITCAATAVARCLSTLSTQMVMEFRGVTTMGAAGARHRGPRPPGAHW